MNRAGILLLLAVPAFAAVTGTVVNRTTGQPQAGATVGLNKLGAGGIELVDQAKSDTRGKFTINQEVRGPYVIRTAFDGVTYNFPLPPGTPTTDLTIEVFNASKQQGETKVTKHMLLFEPSGGQMVVNETFLFENGGKTAWNDSEHGTLKFFAPESAAGQIQVRATAPNGMPIGAPVEKVGRSDTFKVDFPVKPGETRFDVVYTIPYTDGSAYEGRVLTKDDNTYLIAPNGVTLTGSGLKDLGSEPRTQAHIFGLTGTAYKIQLSGTAAPVPGSDSAAADGAAPDNGPQIEQIMPRLYDKVIPIIAIAAGILALGFVLLYRAQGPAGKENDERGRG